MIRVSVAIATTLCFAGQSTAAAIALSVSSDPAPRALRQPFFELLDRSGAVKTRIDATSPVARPGGTSGTGAVGVAMPKAPAVGELRALLAKMRKDPKGGKAAAVRAERLERWLSVISAKTPAERHEAVLKLGVSVNRSVSADGSGLVSEYLVDGRVRVRGFAPLPAPELAPVSGPSADAPATAMDDCYYEGAPDTCATEQELADVDAMAVWVEAETEAGWATYDETTAELDEYCSQNPWDCQALPREAVVPMSGPSAEAPEFSACSDYAASAVGALAASAAEALAWWGVRAGAAASGAAIATGTTAAHYVVLGAAGFFLGYYTAAYVDCKRGRVVRLPEPAALDAFVLREAAR